MCVCVFGWPGHAPTLLTRYEDIVAIDASDLVGVGKSPRLSAGQGRSEEGDAPLSPSQFGIGSPDSLDAASPRQSPFGPSSATPGRRWIMPHYVSSSLQQGRGEAQRMVFLGVRSTRWPSSFNRPFTN